MAKHRTQERSEEMFAELGMYSNSLLNDKKVDGEWVRSVRLSNVTYGDRLGRTYFTRTYSVWNGLKSRCKEGGAFQRRFPWYVGTTICQDWEGSFDAFADWYTSQVGYDLGWDIDKDVLGDNKHYSPETCVLLPRVVNLLFSPHHAGLNVTPAPLPGRAERSRTIDGLLFEKLQDARENAFNLRVKRVNELKELYVPMGLLPIVFEKAIAAIPKA